MKRKTNRFEAKLRKKYNERLRDLKKIIIIRREMIEKTSEDREN